MVAQEYGVSKRAVTKAAVREKWQERLADLEARARESSDKRAVETLEAMNDRHLKSLKVVQRKALEALKAMSLKTAIEAVRALDLAIKHERTIRGEPSDRTAISIEEVIRSEYDRWLSPDEGEEEESTGDLRYL